MNDSKLEVKSEGVRERAAVSLEAAADSVRAAGTEGSEAIGSLAKEAGERLDSTATYVRTAPEIDALGRLRCTVRRNPVGSMAVASAIGLVAGFAWRGCCRRTSTAS